MRKFIIAALAAAVLPGAAQAAAFTNGSLEEGTITQPFSFLVAGQDSADDIAGWLVTGGTIDYIGNYWNAADGARSVDLAGAGNGTLSQTFDTVAGASYLVGFSLAGNPEGDPVTKSVLVSATGGTDALFSIDRGPSLSAMNWTPFSYSFTATGTSTTLNFSATSGGSYGPALDNVSLTAAVPEPTTWAMLIGGFGMVGGTLRRRRATGTLAHA